MSSDFNYRFSSEYLDIETGLVYYNFRYYSPDLGRWCSRDPMGEFGGMNLYWMVGNNLVKRWDWLGLVDGPGFGFGWDPTVLPSLPPNFAKLIDFIMHYFNGDGASIDLGEWGVLENYKNAANVKDFREMTVPLLITNGIKKDKSCSGNFSQSMDATDGLFVMGSGILNAKWQCRCKTCIIDYSINDRFEDPTCIVDALNDGHHQYAQWLSFLIEDLLLGGHSYPMNGEWTEFYELPGDLCCPK